MNSDLKECACVYNDFMHSEQSSETSMKKAINSPKSTEQDNQPVHTGARQLIKGNCTLCSHYHNCPRMAGKNICYGKKEPLSTQPQSSTDYPINKGK
jgi:hypothetical protein